MRTTTGPLETMPTWDHEVAVVVVEGSEAEEASGAEVVALEEASEEVVEDLEVEEAEEVSEEGAVVRAAPKHDFLAAT